MSRIEAIFQGLNDSFGGVLELSGDKRHVLAPRDGLVRLMQLLKGDYKYILLADITSVDYEDHFELVYHVMDEEAELLGVKVRLDRDDPSAPSLTGVWKAADVQEREVFDLMGIVFSGHGNLKRILCRDDFEGHALRKDFKLNFVDRFKKG